MCKDEIIIEWYHSLTQSYAPLAILFFVTIALHTSLYALTGNIMTMMH